MRFNYLISAIFGFMLIHLWIIHTELDRRYMNHLQADRLIESAQNEVIMLNTQQNNKLTDYMVELVNMLEQKTADKPNSVRHEGFPADEQDRQLLTARYKDN